MTSFGEGSERLKRSHPSSLTSVKEEEEEMEDVLDKRGREEAQTEKDKKREDRNINKQTLRERGCREFFLKLKQKSFFGIVLLNREICYCLL